MNAEIKNLIIERGLVKAALTRLQNFFRENAAHTSAGSLKKRLTANASLYDRFNAIQTQIETLVAGSDIEDAHALERETFESTYFDLIDEIETHIERSSTTQRREIAGSPGTGSAVSGSTVNVKLPTIQLPTFSGNYSDWLKFRDSFVSLVHENETLSDVQRFHYPNSSLKGSAARVIQSLGVSEANYKLTWELLNSRYENSTALKRHHVTALLDLKSIQKQSESALRDFLDDATNHRTALRALGEVVDTWDALIIPLLSRKLDIISIREWERRISPYTEMATFAQFSTFLEERAKYLEHVSVAPQVVAPRVDQRFGQAGSRKYGIATSHVINSSTCPACHASHALYQCEKFKKLEANRKTKIVQEAQLCYNCLESGHRVKSCTQSRCKHCTRKHHSLLHRSDLHSTQSGVVNNSKQTEDESVTTQLVSNVSSHPVDWMVLATAIVFVRDNKGKP
ncbi:PREDICTED: uncharacterized protein LOC108577710 [Habropoda laboriosa]|uniref:uncharacterized protein LOC108577710 n=1 Tax=Habropoda laboriosa TaxID=597456 RepID=UPI00083DC91D|nr:PREDICTED: uncharacterized protein LOC108577710 [Habropoda laboriosa]